MSKKILEMFAEYIGREVAYFDNRDLCADMVCEIARRTNKRFNEKAFRDKINAIIANK